MEMIITYLIYILGLVAVIALLCLTGVKYKQIDLKHDMLKMLIEHDYETENIDLEKFVK